MFPVAIDFLITFHTYVLCSSMIRHGYALDIFQQSNTISITQDARASVTDSNMYRPVNYQYCKYCFMHYNMVIATVQYI